jgi:hypothetical protein
MALAFGLAGCWDDANDAPAGTTTYSVGGSVAGLTTAGLVPASGSDTASMAAGRAALGRIRFSPTAATRSARRRSSAGTP